MPWRSLWCPRRPRNSPLCREGESRAYVVTTNRPLDRTRTDPLPRPHDHEEPSKATGFPCLVCEGRSRQCSRGGVGIFQSISPIRVTVPIKWGRNDFDPVSMLHRLHVTATTPNRTTLLQVTVLLRAARASCTSAMQYANIGAALRKKARSVGVMGCVMVGA